MGGHFDKALSFDGVTDYIDCGNAESLQITKSLTVMGWVKPDKALGLAGNVLLHEVSIAN